MTPTWQQSIDRAIDARTADLVRVRRHLHAHPEPSNEEHETARFLHECLETEGFRVRAVAGGRGLVVEAPDTAAPRVALRADTDALRIHEENEVEYRSQRPGVMHACGHDGHTATVFGALLGLRAARASGDLPWDVPWRAIFQPAEEKGTGAREMLAAGVLEGIEAIFSLHMDPSRPVGRIGVRYGALTAACDDLTITIDGRGGHAARPHESLDPIAAAAQLITSIYLFIPRAIDSQDPVVVTIGQVAAGDNPNVIPERAILGGTIRTLGGTIRQKTGEHIRQLARGIAEASGTAIDVAIVPGPPSVINDTRLTNLLRDAAGELLGGGQVDLISRTSMGGEDFSYYLEHVPGSMFRLGCGSVEAGQSSLHSPTFDIDERALAIGARILARAAVMACQPGRGEREVP